MSIPSGWYFCVESSEVKPGQVLRRELFGQVWALWRSGSGVMNISASVCPHLGSDLGKLGKVRGETLQCFSHRYTYDGAGDCVATGFKELPCRTHRVLRNLPVHEVGGFVLAFFDADRREPTWRIPDAVFADENVTEYVRSDFAFDVPVEILNEDNFDRGHLYNWHRVKDVVSSDPKVDGATISITHDFKRHSILFEKPLPKPFDLLTREVVSQYGSTLYGHGLTDSYIDIFNLDLHLQDMIWCTPISAERTMYTTFLRRKLPTTRRSLRQRVLDQVVHPLVFPMTVWRLRQEHLHEGRGFWEAQSRVDDPILTQGERRLIGPYREWCRQFEGSAAPSPTPEADTSVPITIRTPRSNIGSMN